MERMPLDWTAYPNRNGLKRGVQLLAERFVYLLWTIASSETAKATASKRLPVGRTVTDLSSFVEL